MYHGLDAAVNRPHDSSISKQIGSPEVITMPNRHAPERRNALWKDAMRILLYGFVTHVKHYQTARQRHPASVCQAIAWLCAYGHP